MRLLFALLQAPNNNQQDDQVEHTHTHNCVSRACYTSFRLRATILMAPLTQCAGSQVELLFSLRRLFLVVNCVRPTQVSSFAYELANLKAHAQLFGQANAPGA